MEDVNNLYKYLNDKYIKPQRTAVLCGTVHCMMIIEELGLHLWKKYVIAPLKAEMLTLVLGALHDDRTGLSMTFKEKEIINGVLQSLVAVEKYEKKENSLKLYEMIFEVPFLEETSEHYRLEASRLLQEGVSKFMNKILERLDEEDVRSVEFLQISSYIKVRRICEERMVVDKLEAIQNECPTIVQNERKDDLRNAFKLLKLTQGGLSVLASQYGEHIKKQGLDTVTSPIQFVEGIINIHSKYTLFTNTVFSNDPVFVSARDIAFSAVVNQTTKGRCKTPQFFATYCDYLLNKSRKDGFNTEVDEKLTKFMDVLRYLNEKDVFENNTWRLLAKRLLFHSEIISEGEEALLDKLKLACGNHLGTKIRQMLADSTFSFDLTKKLKEMTKIDSESFQVFSVHVLRSRTWPIEQSTSSFAVPRELEKSAELFEHYYPEELKGRQITWLYNLSEGDVQLNYLNKQYTITMGTFQIAILLEFQKTDSKTCGELMGITKLNPAQFQNTIQSLVNSKLLAVAAGKQDYSQPSTVISLNTDFWSSRSKFRLETIPETEATTSFIIKDRKEYLQAVIVRIMKSKKNLHQNVLIQEVLSISKSRFDASVELIQECIKTLIGKKYLEETSTNEYSFCGIENGLAGLYGLVADLSENFHKVIYNFRHEYRSFLRIIRARRSTSCNINEKVESVFGDDLLISPTGVV
ncbi:hypothetical protein DAPPUDRAFT_333213 [Daphnia pulex]|uniref:Cullin family profile domain-containing protein n=1 Tax=Daphnia pulex TaxID=6669 RepID=E9HS81_DAPPU|nr:hypothetical protein DAPPUDRAFT_333213 [Daphnia pulex]|eukprot:EFX65405.1 hypothetical protein DAPPUDRAFT_333213 [Daphnia pulex]